MADTKITALTAITTVDPAVDVFPIVDVSDTTMAASGTTKKITSNQLLGAGGTATLASATITGDLTVDTSTLKVDSANDRVGIGTASPAQFVHLSKSSTSTALTAPPVGGASLRIQNTSSTNNNFGSVEFYNANGLFGGSVNCQFTNQATPTNDLVFVTRGSSGGLEHYRIAADGVCTWSEVGGVAGTAMTLNSTGLGIGAVPGSAIGNLQVGGSSNANLYTQQGTDTVRMGVRASGRTGLLFDSSNATYTNRAWYLDNVGSSGSLIIGRQGLDVITFDNGGNVGVGVTPSAWVSTVKALDISSGGAVYAGSLNCGLAANYYLNSSGNYIYKTTAFAAGYIPNYANNGSHVWFNAPSGTAGNAITFTQAMTLDASGRLLIGTTTATTGINLKIAGGGIYASNTTSISSGSNTLEDRGSAPNTVRLYNATDSNNATDRFVICDAGASVVRAEIRSNGGLANYQANDANLSDERTKTDIKPLASYWNKIKALEVVTFKYKDQAHSDNNIGLIAQQVETVAPELVDVDGFGETPADGVPLKTIYTTDLYHASIKALQEAMVRIEALEAKLA